MPLATWRPPSSSRTWSPFDVEDRDRDVVGLLDAEGQARDVEAPVAVGREDAAHADLPQDGRRVLQALGDEEGPEGGEHEDGEDARRQSAQSVTSEALAISRAPAASSPRATASARRMTPRWQTTSAGQQRGLRAQVGQPRLDARGLLGERLAARDSETTGRSARSGRSRRDPRRGPRRTSGPSSRRCRSRRSARPRSGCRPMRAATTSAVSRARQQRAAPQRDDLHPGGDLGQRVGLLAAGGVERHGRDGPGSGPRGCRPSARGGPGGWSCGRWDYCALSAPTKTATWARSASARALASIALTWAVGTPRILATSSAAARALAS